MVLVADNGGGNDGSGVGSVVVLVAGRKTSRAMPRSSVEHTPMHNRDRAWLIMGKGLS